MYCAQVALFLLQTITECSLTRCMLGITESVFTPLPANINSNKQIPIPLAVQRQEASEKRRQTSMNAAQNICVPKVKPPVTDCLETGPPLRKMPRFEGLPPPLCDKPPPKSLLASALATTMTVVTTQATQPSTVTNTGEERTYVCTMYARMRTHARTGSVLKFQLMGTAECQTGKTWVFITYENLTWAEQDFIWTY